jgi:hypothetical protein
MARTFLALMQQAANELGIPEPSQIIGAQDEQSKQLLALAQREGKDFSVIANKNGGWQNLHKEYTFTTVASTQTGTIADGSAIVTGLSDTSVLAANTFGATGNGIASGAIIQSIDSPTQVTLNLAATASGSVSIIFGQIAYPLPSDLEYFVQRTWWDNTYKWELLGPITAQEKQILKYGIIASGPRSKFYIRVNKMYLNPMPAVTGQLFAYDYFSNAWCQSAGGTAQQLWTADTDTYLLDEDCFIQGIKWRFLRAKGLDYSQEKVDYEMDCQRVMARDAGNRDLPIAGGTYGARFLNDDNIPETNFGEPYYG